MRRVKAATASGGAPLGRSAGEGLAVERWRLDLLANGGGHALQQVQSRTLFQGCLNSRRGQAIFFLLAFAGADPFAGAEQPTALLTQGSGILDRLSGAQEIARQCARCRAAAVGWGRLTPA